jgi:hypothetical protein
VIPDDVIARMKAIAEERRGDECAAIVVNLLAERELLVALIPAAHEALDALPPPGDGSLNPGDSFYYLWLATQAAEDFK